MLAILFFTANVSFNIEERGCGGVGFATTASLFPLRLFFRSTEETYKRLHPKHHRSTQDRVHVISFFVRKNRFGIHAALHRDTNHAMQVGCTRDATFTLVTN